MIRKCRKQIFREMLTKCFTETAKRFEKKKKNRSAILLKSTSLHQSRHERTQVICTGSTLSRGDFCFRVFCGWRRRYNLSSAVSVTVTSLIVGIWKVFKSMVSRDSERDVQPRPRDHSWPSVSSASLRSKMAPRKGFYLFARGINLDLTSKKTRWILNESVCITSPKWIFSLKKRAMVFQKKLRLSTAS